MAYIELLVAPHEQGWTVRSDRVLFERFPRVQDALSRAMRHAHTLRRRGHDAQVRVREAADAPRRRAPRGRTPGDLPPLELG